MWITSIFLIQCVLTVYVVQCNIDIFEPIIRSSPEVNVTKEDLFGYKVVLHQLVSQGGIINIRLASRSRFSMRHWSLFIFILEL